MERNYVIVTLCIEIHLLIYLLTYLYRIVSCEYILSLAAGEIIRRRRCVHRKLCNFRTSIIRLFKQALESEVTKRPGGRAYISLGSLPSRQFRYLKRRIASLVRLGNPASKRCYIQPRALPQALPPGPVLHPVHRHHVLFVPRLSTSTWVLGLSASTPNLSVYEDLRMVQTNLSLPQRSN